MSISEQTLLRISQNMYNDDYKNGGDLGWLKNSIPVKASTSGTSFEQNDLQASVVSVGGQYVVAFRGSAQGDDWMQDGGE